LEYWSPSTLKFPEDAYVFSLDLFSLSCFIWFGLCQNIFLHNCKLEFEYMLSLSSTSAENWELKQCNRLV
jgi:hypothetical protein